MTGTGFQGVPDPARAYRRDNLVQCVLDKLNNRFIIVQSPPASGKSTLLQMVWYKRKKSMIVKYIRMKKGQSPHEKLKAIGIDFENSSYSKEMSEGEVLIMIDDAQNSFSEELNKSFWESLLKTLTIRSNIRFLIASTYLIGGQDSPAEFITLPRISSEEMLLNPIISRDYLVHYLRFPYASNEPLVDLIIEDCGGNIGALAIIHDRFKSKFTHQDPSDRILVDYFMSSELTESMDRLFGSETIMTLNAPYMVDLLYGRAVSIHLSLIANDADFKCYIKCGLLTRESSTGNTNFTSAMSRRYFIRKTYPHRALNDPTNIIELVIESIRKISANTLRNATVGNNFPKEAVFQHLMMTGLTANLKAETNIYPENSCIIGSDTKIKGELDFFINGKLRWGIELLILGRKIKEHRKRFIGDDKYVGLECNEYVVIDFTTNAPEYLPVVPGDNVITVSFNSNDYSKAKCLFLDGSQRYVELSP